MQFIVSAILEFSYYQFRKVTPFIIIIIIIAHVHNTVLSSYVFSKHLVIDVVIFNTPTTL